MAIDPSLTGPLSVIVELSALKEHGVTNVRPIVEDETDFNSRDVIYIVRPTI